VEDLGPIAVWTIRQPLAAERAGWVGGKQGVLSARPSRQTEGRAVTMPGQT
jgi:hypothetical protein